MMYKKIYGRTITEMLGVLAIMGVLTVGAVSGIRYALDKNQANQIMSEAYSHALSLKTQTKIRTFEDGQIYTNIKKNRIASAHFESSLNDTIVFEAPNVIKGVCEQLIITQDDDDPVFLSILVDGNSDQCGEKNTMVFAMKGVKTPHPDINPQPTPDPCENKTCSDHGYCEYGNCYCFDGYTGTDCEDDPQCNSEILCPDPKECINYTCSCPSIGSPGVCQTTGTQNGCPILVNTTGKCGSNGICSDGDCFECVWPKTANSGGTACVCSTNQQSSCSYNVVIQNAPGAQTLTPLQQCPASQYCYVLWQNDCCSATLNPRATGIVYGTCIGQGEGYPVTSCR